jgi:hypothetical protein
LGVHVRNATAVGMNFSSFEEDDTTTSLRSDES